MKITISLIFLLLNTNLIAQLFQENRIFPNVQSIKGKYYSGSGGNGYWTLETLDSLGRVINEKSYGNNELHGTTRYVYNNQNDVVMNISLFDINHPNLIDTNWTTQYKYDAQNRIIFQQTIYDKNHRTTYKLSFNEGDSILVYQEKSYHKSILKDSCWSIKYQHTLHINKNKMINKWVSKCLSDGTIKTSKYWYNSNGQVKRRIFSRFPEYEFHEYVGGPGSDDQSWTYKYDKKRRIKKKYTTVNNKKYKLATYEYYE